MRRMWYGGHGYRHHWGGFLWPGLLFVLFLLVFGKLFWPLLFLLFCAAPLIFWWKGGARWRHWDWNEHPKRKNDEFSGEKPKRTYRQTPDGEWVEIV